MRSSQYTEEQAVSLMEEAAQAGSLQAMSYLAAVYADVRSEYHDGAKAADMCQRILKKEEIPLILFYLAKLYYRGDGVPQDAEKALELFQKAGWAKKYYVSEARAWVGSYYFWGNYLEQDYKKAAECFESVSALDSSDCDIQFCYLYLMFYGLGGVKQSRIVARENMDWICEKSKNPEVRREAAGILCQSYEPDGRDKTMAPLTRASLAGNLAATCKLAVYYMNHIQIQKTVRSCSDDHDDDSLLSYQEFNYDNQAMECLLRVLEQKCPTQEETNRQIQALLRYSDAIAHLNPNLLEILKMRV